MTSVNSSFSLMDLSPDILFNEIAMRLSVPICGALRQTCKLMNQFPDSKLLELLKKRIPVVFFDHMQTELDGYKEQFAIDSNIRKGVCQIKIQAPFFFQKSNGLKRCDTRKCGDFTELVHQITRETLEIIPISLDKIMACQMSKKYAIIIGRNKSLIIWDRHLEKIKIIQNAHSACWPLFCIHEDILFSRDTYEIKIWDLKTAFCLVKLKTLSDFNNLQKLSFYKGKLFIRDCTQWQEMYDFSALDIQILTNISNLLKDPFLPIAREANLRCKRMPPRTTKTIKKEFKLVKNEENFYFRLSQAINNYITKKLMTV